MKLWPWGWVLAWLLLGCATPRPTEFINIAYTPSVATGHYATWAFDLASCRDSRDPRIDDARVHGELLRSLEEWLREHGFEQRTSGAEALPPDFLVSFAVTVSSPAGGMPGRAGLRARVLVQDVATGRYVWRGERKVLEVGFNASEDPGPIVDLFVGQVLQDPAG